MLAILLQDKNSRVELTLVVMVLPVESTVVTRPPIAPPEVLLPPDVELLEPPEVELLEPEPAPPVPVPIADGEAVV